MLFKIKLRFFCAIISNNFSIWLCALYYMSIIIDTFCSNYRNVFIFWGFENTYFLIKLFSFFFICKYLHFVLFVFLYLENIKSWFCPQTFATNIIFYCASIEQQSSANVASCKSLSWFLYFVELIIPIFQWFIRFWLFCWSALPATSSTHGTEIHTYTYSQTLKW